MSTPKEVMTRRILFRRVFPAIGVMGLAITVTMNLVALLIFKREAAAFFSHGWWPTWSPNYMVSVIFLIIGAAGLAVKKE
jgi:hypothetical protein